MAWICNIKQRICFFISFIILMLSLTACSISYKFNGGSLDYTRLHTISIADVNNRAPQVYPPFAVKFTEDLRDFYTRRTRLDLVPRAGDLELECVITGYDLSPMAVGQDNFAERTMFKVTVQVKYVNNVDEKESFDRSFSAHRDFPRNQLFTDVQDELLEEIIKELIDQIYNATVENW